MRIIAASPNVPKGELADARLNRILNVQDQLFRAKQYAPVIVAYRNGAPVRISDVGTVNDSQQNAHKAGQVNGKTSVLLTIYRQPSANIMTTVDGIREILPMLRASIPPSIHIDVTQDRTTTIRASVHEVEVTMAISVALVILVVFVFLRSLWATAIPSVAVPLSLVGTFGVMYLLGYTIDNLSLMALTISTGFVVDDAIVVIENITRYLEQGLSPMQAALRGSREIGFTVLSMSTSLIAAFIPILLMGGIMGRIFREFAITLAVGRGDFHGRFADHHSDDVFEAASRRRETAQAQLALPRQRAGISENLRRLRKQPALGAAAPADHPRPHAGHRGPGGLPLHRDSQRLLPAAGHRPP